MMTIFIKCNPKIINDKKAHFFVLKVSFSDFLVYLIYSSENNKLLIYLILKIIKIIQKL